MSVVDTRAVETCEAGRKAPAGGEGREPRRGLLDLLIVAFVVLATLGAVWGGPSLGDHECLVAQCARDMRTTGHWLVPHYLGEPYVRKPPLPYWMIAGLSYVFPKDANTDLPVTTSLARLPSALASFGTVMLLWAMGSAMFGRRVGRVTAVIGASSLFFLLYAANATVEMILTFCCAWAYAHFWFALQHPVGSGRRRLHLFLYYVALGLGMMAKGPFPMVMVGLPIAAWWYGAEPLEFVALGGQRAWGILKSGAGWKPALQAYAEGWRQALVDGVFGFGRRTIRAFRELWLLPGLVVFALCFVPWMVAVGKQHPHAWNLWNWQYLQRVEGKYDDTRPRGPFYYVPVIAGLVLPWIFLLPEALASPWMSRYAKERRALLLAGLWAVIGAVVMSMIAFKKPYYVAPAIPGFTLLLGVVAERFYARPIRSPRLGWSVWIAVAIGGIGAVIGGYFLICRDLPNAAGVLTGIAAGALVLLLAAGVAFIRGRAWAAFGMTAVTMVLAFMASWFTCGEVLDNIGQVAALNAVFEKQEVPANAKVMWVSRRQDSRLSFYFARYTQQMIQPAEIVDMFVDRTKKKSDLEELVLSRAQGLLKSPEPVYLILGREELSMARMMGVGEKAHVLGFAPDKERKDKDWMVVSNVPAKQ